MASNEELLIDIRNTEKELGAFEKLSEGYMILSTLPEQSETQRKEYMLMRQKYDRLWAECDTLLCKLLDLKKERQL